jgi:hypothetical protein
LNFYHIGEALGADFNRERPLEIAIPGRKVNGFFTAIVFGGGVAYIPLTFVTFGKKTRADVQNFFWTLSVSTVQKDIFPW